VQNPNYQMAQPNRMPITDNAGLINEKLQPANERLQHPKVAQQSTRSWAALFGLTGTVIASDIRVKTDIKRIGERDGLGVYEFRYINDDLPRVGYMAQEVMQTKPEAVVDRSTAFSTLTTRNCRRFGNETATSPAIVLLAGRFPRSNASGLA
jgi:hypothetical protein